MKTSFKSEIQNFSVTGFKTDKVKSGPRVHLAFQAEAKGRLVEWNKISGSALVPLALVTTEGFGPGDIDARDFSWVVHISRRGKPVNRAMKATPRKSSINSALCQLLAPALASGISDAQAVKPKRAPKTKTVAPKGPVVSSDLDGLVEGLEAVGLNVITSIPKAGDPLEMPEFLKR